MNPFLRNLRQLIDDGMYVVDARAVADAIVVRGKVRTTVAQTSFRSEVSAPALRSFRRDDHARSFRLERSSRLQRLR